MKNNADLTIFNKYTDATTRAEKWQRTQIPGVMWENRKAANTLASGGNLSANQATIYIPFQRGENFLPHTEWQALTIKSGKWTLQEGDFVVRGLVRNTISTTYTITDLKAAYPQVLSIKSIDTMDMGSASMSHWQVGAA